MYSNPVYRPPSEGRSLIIQITEGCSHNKCTFCGMYKGKQFRIKNDEEVIAHIEYIKKYDPNPRKIFIADGDFLCLSTEKILHYLEMVKSNFPNVERISCYSGPLDLLRKTPEDLTTIREAGLAMLYMGVESGNDEILRRIKKGVNGDQMIEAGRKAVDAGFVFSCMIISGIGSNELVKEHALDSAKVISAINPQYFALLTLNIDEGTELAADVNSGKFKLMTPDEIMDETYLMLDNMDLTDCIFRSNHVSNYVNLSGVLNRDKEKMLEEIKEAMKEKNYTPEHFRRL
jgi:radical SAM superfamily enzyme YgiQ (UPF0313 family)